MNHQLPLTQNQLDWISKQPMVCFKEGSTLIYRGHIPIIAYFIKSGEVQYLDAKRNVVLSPTNKIIIGAYENLNYVPFDFSVIAKTDLQLKIVNRSLLNKMFSAKRLLTYNCI